MAGLADVIGAIRTERIRADLEKLFELGREPGREGAWRLAFSAADRRGRDFVFGLMQAAGLAPRVDEAGNLIGTVCGRVVGSGALVIGSHIDTVPGGGMFDGALGVIGGIEVARAMREVGYAGYHPIEVIAFSNEEKARFPTAPGGSAAMVRGIASLDVLEVRDGEGVSLAEAMAAAGLEPSRLGQARREAGFCRGYLELHVEQGGRLAREGVAIGVVSAIVGITRAELCFRGRPNHAGTTPMEERQDALWGAVAMVAEVREAALVEAGELVGTVGQLRVSPGAANVVPGEAELTVELRSADEARLARTLEALLRRAREIAAAYRLELEVRRATVGRAVPMDEGVRQHIAAACEDLGLSYKSLVSWAGHDASQFAPVAPTGMIFVPSVGGISHAPDELTCWADAAAGVKVLASTVCRLDRELAGQAG